MILISHRGNIDGPFPKFENKPKYINQAIHLGYDVEVDVWLINEILFLGHDKPQYKVNQKWFQDRKEKLWIHCKNTEAIIYFSLLTTQYNYFWHQEDAVTLTSKNFIWAYPGKQPIKNSVAVMPELYKDNIDTCIGICSDYIKNYKK